MASYNGERCIRLWELPSFEPRGTLGDVNNARAMAGSAAAQLVFSGDEHGRVKARCGGAGRQAGQGLRQGTGRLPLPAQHAANSPPCPVAQVWKWKAPAAAGGFPQQ